MYVCTSGYVYKLVSVFVCVLLGVGQNRCVLVIVNMRKRVCMCMCVCGQECGLGVYSYLMEAKANVK